jgi:periplasmic protein TonB
VSATASIAKFLRTRSTLSWALAFSVAVHLGLMTLKFVSPETFDRVFQDSPLEVILVNAKSNEKPDKAQAIAQASLAGGGEADKGRATSPLPPSALTEIGESPEEATKKNEALQDQQNLLLAQIRKSLAAMPERDPKTLTEATPEEREQEEKRRQLLKLLAEIEKRVSEENSRPKKRYISPATRGEVYAVYYDALRRKIEDKGTENFPEAGGKKLYGVLTMIVTINHDGRLIEAEVVQSSGNRQLDRRALAIAKSAAPFGAFGATMRNQADQIVVVSRFKFTRDETLQTTVTGSSSP